MIYFFYKVAFDEMQNKVQELNNVITQNPPDMKKLQLVLQGSVSVQVNESCDMMLFLEGSEGWSLSSTVAYSRHLVGLLLILYFLRE